MRNSLLIFLFALFLFSCNKLIESPEKKCFVPYVDFTAHVNPSTLEVDFSTITATNGTITSYNWDFGDGTSFKGQMPPVHKYPAPSSPNGSSTYKVKLTVANDCGEAFWTRDVVISGCLPDPKFSYKYLSDSTVEFTNQTNNLSSSTYTWNFGDGTTGTDGGASFTHVYKEDKSFVVSLKAKNACGENNYTEMISVCRKPEAFQTVSVNSCGVLAINASASKNAIKYQWDLGNGTVLPASPSTSSTLSYTYPKSGTYTVTLKVFNAAGCDSATTSNSVTVSASSLETNSNWSYNSDDLDFAFTRASITNAASYKWNFGDGANSTLQNPTHTYANPGVYTITLTASSSCGASYEFGTQINVPYYNALNNVPSTGFQQVLAFSSSLIYFLGKNGELYKTDTAGSWSTINLPNGLAYNNETRLYKDLHNNLWIYGKKEVARLNSNGNGWTSFFNKTDFKNNVTITSMAVDNNDVLWTIGEGVLKKEDATIRSAVPFTSVAYAPASNKIWVTSSAGAGLYYINSNSNQLNPVINAAVAGGGDNVTVAANGEIYFSTSTGIVRINSSGTLLNSYTAANTNGFINGRATTFDLDSQNNLWVLLSGQLYKLPVNSSSNTKKYSFNSDLDNLSWISVLNLSSSDTDILLSKTSGNAAIKIR